MVSKSSSLNTRGQLTPEAHWRLLRLCNHLYFKEFLFLLANSRHNSNESIIVWTCPSSSCVGILTCSAVSGGGSNERWVGLWGCVPMNGLMPLSWEWVSYQRSRLLITRLGCHKSKLSLLFLSGPLLLFHFLPWNDTVMKDLTRFWHFDIQIPSLWSYRK